MLAFTVFPREKTPSTGQTWATTCSPAANPTNPTARLRSCSFSKVKDQVASTMRSLILPRRLKSRKIAKTLISIPSSDRLVGSQKKLSTEEDALSHIYFKLVTNVRNDFSFFYENTIYVLIICTYLGNYCSANYRCYDYSDNK
jgi:hypothetical protein